MSKRKRQQASAVGGALSPDLTQPPVSFNQFVASQPAPAYTPLRGPDPTGAVAAANQQMGTNPYTPITGPDPTGAIAVANRQAANPDANPVGPFDPALFHAFMRHKYWMDNAKNRGDDTATYGAGPMRTMAF